MVNEREQIKLRLNIILQQVQSLQGLLPHDESVIDSDLFILERAALRLHDKYVRQPATPADGERGNG